MAISRYFLVLAFAGRCNVKSSRDIEMKSNSYEVAFNNELKLQTMRPARTLQM